MSIESLIRAVAEGVSSINGFNRSCGNIPEKLSYPDLLKAIKNQAERTVEEAKEIVDGAETDNRQEILDGAVDAFVTAVGSMLQVQATIGDVAGAIQAICDNNDLKYTDDRAEAQEWLAWYESEYDPNKLNDSYYICEAEHAGILWFSIKRRSDNKIMKPPRHPKVNLSAFLYNKD